MRAIEWSVLILAVLALCFTFWIVYRRKRGTYRLEEDATGFWRYYKNTQFERKLAYGKKLGRKECEKKEKKKAIAVINFDGDIRAKQHRTLAKLVDELEVNKEKLEEGMKDMLKNFTGKINDVLKSAEKK